MVMRMIATNSLAAFTAEVSRSQGISQARGTTSASPGTQAAPQPAERRLDALPSAPTGPMPRGSLLDLRV